MDTPTFSSKHGRRRLFILLFVLCIVGGLIMSNVTSVSHSHVNVLANFIAVPKRLYTFGAGLHQELSVVNGKQNGTENSADGSKKNNRWGNQFTHSNNSSILLIVGYLRSGSTFTASLFRQHADTFYVFEPLHKFMSTLYKTGVLRYINGTKRHYKIGFLQELAGKAMQRWINCDFANLDIDSLADEFHYSHRTDMKSFAICLRTLRTPRQKTNIIFRQCALSTAEVCRKARFRVFKTIRVSMSTAEHLFAETPNLKIIHLVRDPRGMFNSQTKTNELLDMNDESRIRSQCKNILKDLEVTTKMLRSYPDNVYAIRYEDIAYDPFGAAQKLYDFAGMTLNSKIINYINISTSLNLKDSCQYCTRRSNSTQTANKWRTNISHYLLNVIDTHCSRVYDKIGYFYLNKTMLTKIDTPSVTSLPLIEYLKQNNQ